MHRALKGNVRPKSWKRTGGAEDTPRAERSSSVASVNGTSARSAECRTRADGWRIDLNETTVTTIPADARARTEEASSVGEFLTLCLELFVSVEFGDMSSDRGPADVTEG